MEPTEIFMRYLDEVSLISLYQSAIKDNAKNELEQLVQHEKTCDDYPELKFRRVDKRSAPTNPFMKKDAA